MEPVIRVDLNKMVCDPKPLIVELGCGRKKKEGILGIDRLDMPGVDIVADLENGLLHVDLARPQPAKQVKTIEINAENKPEQSGSLREIEFVAKGAKSTGASR